MGYMPAIVINPGAVLQNLIQPVADDVCLTLRPFSDAQVNPALLLQNAAGSIDLFRLEANGDVTSNQTWIANAPFTLSPSFGPTLLQIIEPVHGNNVLFIRQAGNSTHRTVEIDAADDGDVGLQVYGN